MGVRPSTRRTRPLLLAAGALLLAAHTGGWPLAAHTPPAAADGVGSHALALSVTVNTRPGREAEHTGIRVGHPVVKHYRLTNRSGADLYRVRVHDPDMPGAAVRCPGGRGLWMRGLTSVTCTARAGAAPGTHTATVRAHAEIPSLGLRPSASAAAGYQGVAGALRLAVAVREVDGPRAVLQYTVGNPGNRTVHGVRLSDTTLAPHRPRISCGGRPGSSAQTLRPGATVLCVAELDGLRPGTYRSGPEVRGSDGLFTLDPAGGLIGPPPLAAHAATQFTVRAARPRVPEPPVPARPGAPPGRALPQAPPAPPGGAGAPGTAGGAAAGGPGTPGAPAPGTAGTASVPAPEALGARGAPGVSTPGAPGAPAPGTPGADAPGAGAPGAGAPGAPAVPGAGAPGAGAAGAGAPGAGAAGAGAAGAGAAGAGAAGAGAAGAGAAGAGAAGAGAPGAPGAGAPGAGAPGAGAAGAGTPGAGAPGAGAPGAGLPGVDAPGAGLPGLGTPDAAGIAPPPPPEAAGVAPPPTAPRTPPRPERRATPEAEATPRPPTSELLTVRRAGGGPMRRDEPFPVVAVLLLFIIPAGIVATIASRRQ